jgi:ribosomal protein L29
MELKELKLKNKGELAEMLVKEREKLRSLRFDLASGKIKGIKEIRQMKKEIARILTLINTEK